MFMRWSTAIKWIMLISGALTLTMFFAMVAPQQALQATFGETMEGPLADIVVRNWGFLIGMIGAMLIYGAYRPAVRPLVLVAAGASKLVFIGLILIYGQQYLGKAALAAGLDLLMVMLYAAYLIAGRRGEGQTVTAPA
jgi:hypothetical protein